MSEPATSSAQIHDLGYERYTGERLPQTRRFWVIARNVLTIGWSKRWSVKVPCIAAALTTLVAAGIMVIKVRFHLSDRAFSTERIIDFVMEFNGALAFVVALMLATVTIADDLKLGAFQFYFSRPIRPIDYVTGKLLGLLLLLATFTLGAPLFLAIVRLTLCESLHEAGTVAPLLVRTTAAGILSAASYALPAAGVGALMQARQPAQAFYAVYYLIVPLVTFAFDRILGSHWIELLSLNRSRDALIRSMLGVKMFGLGAIPRWSAAASVVVILAASVAILFQRIRRAETAGLGGG